MLSSSRTVSLPRGHEVYLEGGPLAHVYFPVDGLCSIAITLTNGVRVETWVVGSEGMVGLPVYLGLDACPYTAVYRIPGNSLQVPAASFLRAAVPGSALERLLRRYSAYLMRSAHQAVACNAAHTVEERMCRWVLMAQDRADGTSFP